MLSETVETLVYGKIEFRVLNAEETKATIVGKSIDTEIKESLNSDVYLLDNGRFLYLNPSKFVNSVICPSYEIFKHVRLNKILILRFPDLFNELVTQIELKPKQTLKILDDYDCNTMKKYDRKGYEIIAIRLDGRIVYMYRVKRTNEGSLNQRLEHILNLYEPYAEEKFFN